MTELINDRSDNKTIGFELLLSVIGESKFSKCAITGMYGVSSTGIDTASVTLTINRISGEDMVSTSTEDVDKLIFYVNGANNYGAIFALSNKTGENLHINADITLFLRD